MHLLVKRILMTATVTISWKSDIWFSCLS